MPDTLLWQGPEHGDGETLARAYRCLTGRDFEPGRCQWEEIRGDSYVYHYRDGVVVTIGHGGRCAISRAGEGGGGGAG